MSSGKNIVLVDGSSYLYRAFHALPPLSGPQGQPTSVIYGVVNMLKKLLADKQPDYFAVVFDAKGKTFRHEIYSEYKANRPPMPEDLSRQISPLFELIEALGYPIIQTEGVEADDVIGTLALKAKSERMEVLISTGDKDLAQLVGDGVTLLNTMKDEYLDAEGVVKKMGVEPAQVVDYLTLTGDKSDNVPGVAGVGPKTAAKWLAQYKTLDALTERAGEIKGKAGENLRQALDRLPLSKRLVTIRCDLDPPAEFSELTLKPPARDRLLDLYAEFGFKTWLKDLDATPNQETNQEYAAIVQNYELILDRKSFKRWLKKLENAGGFAFDTETTSPNYMQARVVGISFSTQPEEAAYVPFGHDYENAPSQLPEDEVLGALKPLLENPDVEKTGHHLKYDRNVLANHGVELRGIRYDSMLESYVYNSVASRHDLDDLAEKYLGITPVHYEDVAGKGVRQKPFNRVALEPACRYAAESADLSLRLHRHLWPALERPQKELYEELELPLVAVLSDVERCGVLIDAPALEAQSAELEKRIVKLEAKAHQAAGREFNLDSPVQIREILFEDLGLPAPEKKTPKGLPSTAEDVLHGLFSRGFELPGLILDHRALRKLKSTYTDKLPRMVDPDSGRVHTSYHQAVTATGRLSSSDPNLQNIPVRTPEGRKIRRAFIAPEGRRLLAADYSQIELRIMAHLSEDESLCRAFEAQEDVHTATAAEIFSVPAEQVTPEQRRSAKAINFGLIYGMGAYGLAQQLGLDFESARQYKAVYFEHYPGVKAYMDKVIDEAKSLKCVETVFGRRLYLPEINSRVFPRRMYAERTAINAPIQGTAADVMKRAMTSLHKWLQTSGCDASIIMQVHDELVIEVAEEDVREVAAECRSRMSAAARLSVPLQVAVGEGKNWDEAH